MIIFLQHTSRNTCVATDRTPKKRSISSALLLACYLTIAHSDYAHSESTYPAIDSATPAEAAWEYQFDTSFLAGSSAKSLKVEQFNQSGIIPTGRYELAISVNRRFSFRSNLQLIDRPINEKKPRVPRAAIAPTKKPQNIEKKQTDKLSLKKALLPSFHTVQSGEYLSLIARNWGRSTGQSSPKLTRQASLWIAKNNPNIFSKRCSNGRAVNDQTLNTCTNNLSPNDRLLLPKVHFFDFLHQKKHNSNHQTFERTPSANDVTIPLAKYQEASPKLEEQVHQDNFSSLEFNVIPCFTYAQLLNMGVSKQALPPSHVHSSWELSSECQALEQWLPEASYQLHFDKLAIDVHIPQALLSHRPQGYVNPKQWDRGINASQISYRINAGHRRNRAQIINPDNTLSHTWVTNNNASANIQSGVNVLGWRAVTNGSWQWNEANGSRWQTHHRYLERGITAWRSWLQLGDIQSSGELLPSSGFRGVQLINDNRMQPYSQQGYAPVVEGVAKSAATVEVRQKDRLIYRTQVPAGRFTIDDITPIIMGADLQVTIIESDGSTQSYALPYLSTVGMLRPHEYTYSFSGGQLDNSPASVSGNFSQAEYRYGFNNHLTGYASLQWHPNYQAGLMSASLATAIGGFSIDHARHYSQFNSINAQSDLSTPNKGSGQRWRLRFQREFQRTNTDLQFSLAYRPHDHFFRSMNDQLFNRESGLATEDNFFQPNREISLAVRQPMSAHWGSLSFSGTWQQWTNLERTQRNWRLSYSNQWGKTQFYVDASRQLNTLDTGGASPSSLRINLSISRPLDWSFLPNSYTSINQSGTHSEWQSSRWSISGAYADGNVQYQTSVIQQKDRNSAFQSSLYLNQANTRWYGNLDVSRHRQQAALSNSGSLVVHGDGITFSPHLGNTLVLIQAKGAEGAKVHGTSGIKIDKHGYALLSSVTPYRSQRISLDPSEITGNAELTVSSQTVTPYAGAIVQSTFDTQQGEWRIFRVRQLNGDPLPLGAEVTNPQGEHLGYVGQGSMIYLFTHQVTRSLAIHWGEQRRCQVNLPENSAFTLMPSSHQTLYCDLQEPSE